MIFMRAGLVLSYLLLSGRCVDAFQPWKLTSTTRHLVNVKTPHSHVIQFLLSSDESTTTTMELNNPAADPQNNLNEESNRDINKDAARWKEEAARIRLEAEKMDMELTLEKIKVMENKLNNSAWTAKRTSKEIEELEQQLNQLQQKLKGETPVQKKPVTKKVENKKDENEKNNDGNGSSGSAVASTTKDTPSNDPQKKGKVENSFDFNIPGVTMKTIEENGESKLVINLDTTVESDNNKSSPYKSENIPAEEEETLSGFDKSDLELYIPVALEIEERMTPMNATADEKLEAFRSSPELQQHFQKKIATLLVQPMKDLQEMEYLKREYLSSSSRIEKETIKKRIDALEKKMMKETPFQYSDSIYRETPPLTEEGRKERMDAILELPGVLQTLYKKRHNLEASDDLELALELDYYEQQIQLLDQVKEILPLNDESRKELVMAIESLPMKARTYIATSMGLDADKYTTDDMVKEFTKEDNGEKNKWSPLMRDGVVVDAMVGAEDDLPEYQDIEFVDRSRYIEEFYPAISRMEGKHPTQDEINEFVNTVVDKKAFMVTTKPERVVGGWYIRGRNLISDDEASGTIMVERLQKALAKSKFSENMQFFYIPDPSPVTDEDFEMEYTTDPVLLVTGKNAPKFYDYAQPLTKSLVTLFGLSAVAFVALGSVALQPAIQDRLEVALTDGTRGDLDFVTDTAAQIFLSMIAIQLAHEVGHRIVAWKDKFKLGVPTAVPSIQLGLLGAITPLKTPPPNLKSMFDLGIAGPLAGLTVSLGLLLSGLDITSHLNLNQVSELPVFPSYLFRASALGGGLIEFFLGKGTLTQSVSDVTLLPLHPFAIAGFAGLLANALALLPLGNTDGGRISVAMFGRRGAYIVKTFTTIILCAAGIFGLDDSRIFLVYVLFTSLYQRELETPAVNEVDELDFPRGAFGILTALAVALTLIPMQ